MKFAILETLAVMTRRGHGGAKGAPHYFRRLGFCALLLAMLGEVGCGLDKLDGLSAGGRNINAGGRSGNNGTGETDGGTCDGTGGCSELPPVVCTNGLQDIGESDTDCGGETLCSRCSAGKFCGNGPDCEAGVCIEGICAEPTCSDQVKNGSETDKDCGGVCPGCAQGAACVVPTDCASLVCVNEKCGPASCNDHILNGDEPSMDCGGSCSSVRRCNDADRCNKHDDCVSLSCANNQCMSPTCSDKIKNPNETDVDCGGSCSSKCGFRKGCKQAADCTTGYCASGICLLPVEPAQGVRAVYWPVRGQSAIEGIPWEKITQVHAAWLGVSKTYECKFWTDQSTADREDAVAESETAKLIAYAKAHYPKVKVILSIGGPTLSYRFSDAMIPARRIDFANSCVSLVRAMNADGLEIDWRYPTLLQVVAGDGACRGGDVCQRSTDAANLSTTLGVMRQRLNDLALTTRSLSITVRPNGEGDVLVPYSYAEFFSGAPRRLDWVTLLSHEFHSSQEKTVNFSAPLQEGSQAMDYLRRQVGDLLAVRLILSVPFSGPAWTNVGAPNDSGVGGKGDGLGAFSFADVKAKYVDAQPSECKVRTPSVGNVQNRYVYCDKPVGAYNNLWISYDDDVVLRAKAHFALSNEYGGVAWWMHGQDTSTNTLVTTIHNEMTIVQRPFRGVAWKVPGVIQAEDFDVGGPGVSYSDSTSGNIALRYRAQDVDISVTRDSDGGYDVGNTQLNEWLEYTVDVQETASYDVAFRVANSGAGKRITLEIEGDVRAPTPAVTLPDTSGGFGTAVLSDLSLTKGKHVLRVGFAAGAVTFNWFQFTKRPP